MKEPTTEFSKAIQENAQITKTFLESEGWLRHDERPLFDSFTHKSDSNVKCSIGLYGEFSIVEYHWINTDEPVRVFSTINPDLTIEDYHTIVRLLKIKLKP